MDTVILSLDQGTTSSRALIYDAHGLVRASAQQEFRQSFPQSGWVEHDPDEIWRSQIDVAHRALQMAAVKPQQVAAIGITNQRETTIIWDRQSGEPIYPAIVWQDRRGAQICEQLKQEGMEHTIRQRTGLVIDAYFSASKIKWLLDNVPRARDRARGGRLAFGTVDSWLIWKLSGLHITDYTNASRTMIFNIQDLCWDEELLRIFDIPLQLLPEVRPSSKVCAMTDKRHFDGCEIPIAGIAGDQHAALFGQACFEYGDTKNTYGTGNFLMMNTGNQIVLSSTGMLSTIAWFIGDEVTYALEGAIFVTGAAIQWLRDQLGIIRNIADSSYFAAQVPDTAGVYMVPAFAGLGAPYWDMYARGAIVGLTRGADRRHIIRATLESLAYQTRDTFAAMRSDVHTDKQMLKVDGGASANDFLMQFQADILNMDIVRPTSIEATSRGVAYLAGLAVGMWENKAAIRDSLQIDRAFHPEMSAGRREELYRGWQQAVARTRTTGTE